MGYETGTSGTLMKPTGMLSSCHVNGLCCFFSGRAILCGLHIFQSSNDVPYNALFGTERGTQSARATG